MSRYPALPFNPLPADHNSCRFKKSDGRVLDRCLVNPITQYWTCIFFTTGIFFCHLKLEIELAIPTSNERKLQSAQGQHLLSSSFIWKTV